MSVSYNRGQRLRSLLVGAERLALLRRLLASEEAATSALWRRLQLLELLDQLPLPTQLIACPGCGGGGDRTEPRRSCPGECCQVCGFCMGRRFFRPDELLSAPTPFDGTPSSITVTVYKTTRGERAASGYIIPRRADVDESGLAHVRADAGRRLRLAQHSDELLSRSSRVASVRIIHPELPIVEEDALLLLRRCDANIARDAVTDALAQDLQRLFRALNAE